MKIKDMNEAMAKGELAAVRCRLAEHSIDLARANAASKAIAEGVDCLINILSMHMSLDISVVHVKDVINLLKAIRSGSFFESQSAANEATARVEKLIKELQE